MSVICPTVTAYTTDEYKQQLDAITPFAQRIHIDFMDGDFAPTVSPPISTAWWPHKLQIDMHVMYRHPMDVLDDIIAHHPHLVILQAESEDVASAAHTLHEERIKIGIALLQDTPVEVLHQYAGVIDHVLIFSGILGRHGGTVDLGLLEKVRRVKELLPHVEVGWDGGINADTIRTLADGGVDVLNTGGAIQKSDDPQNAYNYLVSLLS